VGKYIKYFFTENVLWLMLLTNQYEKWLKQK
jgi:hypothetical protein